MHFSFVLVMWLLSVNPHGALSTPLSKPAPLFTDRTDVLPHDLMKSRSRETGCYNDRGALNFDRHLVSAAAARSCGKTSACLVIGPIIHPCSLGLALGKSYDWYQIYKEKFAHSSMSNGYHPMDIEPICEWRNPFWRLHRVYFHNMVRKVANIKR